MFLHYRLRLAQRQCFAIVVAAMSSLVFSGPASASDLDCADFGTREAANHELNRTLDEFGRDTYNLDADRDGEACERNGSAMWWTGIAAAAGILVGFSMTPSRMRTSDAWVEAVGHATAGFFAGLFAGWLLPGILPRQLTVAVFALGAASITGFVEYKVTTASHTNT